ncbi:MAG: T9SS type A sorting domain-containing protein, partial [Flavobacteriales bacterium]|nr:T9SS type A sorting domain-containing protein [Flavobacteriales bacterium]
NTTNITTCDASYAFGGMTLTTSGMYADTNSNVNGCDSIEVLNIVFNTGSTNTTNITTCDASYAFGGMTLTTSGMYADTNSNVNGCDSIEVLNIVFNTGSTNTTNITTCDASYAFGGMTLTTSGMYADTNSNVNGCDSIEVLNIVFNTPTSASSTVETCDPVFNFAGQVFTSSTIFVDTLNASNGCDSVHTYNIVLHPKVYGDTLDIATCDFPYTHNGLQYSTAGLNQITTTSTVTGCDSIYYLDIVFNETHDTVVTVSDICESYYVFNQDTLTASGVHVFNFASVAGCDSVVNLHLSFAPDLTPQILVNQFVLSVPNTYNSYQWYSCTTNQPISGAVGNSFAPTVDGDYYLIVESAYGCTHQSECVEFRGISVEEYLFANITMYPNPTTGKIYMTFSQEFDYQILNKVRVMNSLGQAIFESSEITSNKEINLSDFQNGIYFVEFSSVYGNKIQKKIIKQ